MPRKKKIKKEVVANLGLFDAIFEEITKPIVVEQELVRHIPQIAKKDEIYSVFGLSQAIQNTLEGTFGNIRIEGEVSNYKKHHKTGHVYFSLKDQEAVIDVVCWRGITEKSAFELQDGQNILLCGKVSINKKSSKYSIITLWYKISGVGEILRLIQKTRLDLEKLGLFDKSLKPRLPFFPKNIGVITSPSGSVIRDIIHRIKMRFPTSITIYPANMQGSTCVQSVIEGLKYFNSLSVDNPQRPDVIIIARGGGSMEDLMPFNEKAMALSVCESKIPIISAIGHETDYTILDDVATLRAPTPTAAAELCTPVKQNLEADLELIFKQSLNATKIILSIHEKQFMQTTNFFNIYQAKILLLSEKIASFRAMFLKAVDGVYHARNLYLEQILNKLRILSGKYYTHNIEQINNINIWLVTSIKNSYKGNVEYLALYQESFTNKAHSLILEKKTEIENIKKFANAQFLSQINNIERDLVGTDKQIDLVESIIRSKQGLAILKINNKVIQNIGMLKQDLDIATVLRIEMLDGEIEIEAKIKH